MLRTAYLVLTVLLLIAAPQAADAQVPAYYKALQDITKINKSRPAQNGNYESVKDVLKSRVIDSKNKVVGETRDLIVDRNGLIRQMRVDFNRLNLGTGALLIGYSDLGMTTATNGYKMSYSDSQIEEILPSLLNATQTAAGKTAGKRYNVRDIMGKSVKRESGNDIGKVQDILFSDNGRRADYIVVKVSGSGLRGKNVAIPFRDAKYGAQMMVSDVTADAIIEYAKSR